MKYLGSIRFVIALVLALIAFFTLWCFNFHTNVTLIFSWLIFSLSYTLQSAYTFTLIDSREISKHCEEEDLSTWFLFGFIVTTCTFALIIISSVINEQSNWNLSPFLGTALCVSSVGFSWIVLHICFTFRYAHVHFGQNNLLHAKHADGLNFPDDEQPDYWDFAYYSFTVGMTFQVSDVTINTKGIRRLTLIHALISFVFNTIIIALTINQIVR